mgnify:CR=1 FL=1
MILSVDYLYWLAGILLVSTALIILRDKAHPRRFMSATFWADLGILFIVGDKIPPAAVGIQILALSAIAAGGGLRRSVRRRLSASVREANSRRLNWKLLIPVLAIPFCTLVGTLLLKKVKVGSTYLIDPSNTNSVSFGVGCVVALALVSLITRDGMVQAVRQSREMTDVIAWTLIMPQMLAMLGGMFQHTGVGEAGAYLATHYVATDVKWIAVVVYCLGMFLLSMILGGAAGAIPVMFGAMGVPVLISSFHGTPAVVATLGHYAGFAGVLMTPMAAHFNLIPAAVLEIPDRYAVIKAQAPTAICIFLACVVYLYILM